ncbi:hypothetical protein MJL22_27655, partial [Salmonella enterica subsp. enterica serovar Montevideo]|nr:hypothetical protein [Salmonella enterica subsp. enterica serovar Montevideo]
HVNDEGEIVYGIGAIKGVGEGPIEAIIDARNQGGYFRELFDLPSAGFTSSCTARIKLCHNGFILDSNITTTLISGISRECQERR